jgi:type VI secretion system protein ImpC
VAHDRTEVHLGADFSAPPGRPIESGVFRIGIFGDFAGAGAGKSAPLAQRRTWRVDRDDVDAVMSQLVPTLRVALDPNDAPTVITFSALDDFHPDQLLRRVPLFQRLLALRNEASATASSPAAPPARRGQQPDAVAVDLSSGSLLDRIVEGSRPAGDASAPSARDDLAEFVSRAIRSHIVAEKTPEQRDLVAKVDDVITATMRVLLHHPGFQALESLWRSVDFLVRRLDTSESMQVSLIDCSREELDADLAAADIGGTSMYRLVADASGGQPAWSLLVGAYTFGPADVDLLSKLATLGRAGGAPWLAAAHPRFLGIESFAGTDSDDYTANRSSPWDSLRASSSAAFLSLSAPRFLVRVPYGRRGEECEAMKFEELGDGRPEHESFLWGNGAFACALAIAGGVVGEGAAASRGEIDGLPLYVAPIDGEPTAIPCAEMVSTLSDVQMMLDAGLTPLTAPRDGDTILIPRIQAVASPARQLSIRTPSA